VLFCWITQDFELYAAFHPLADKVGVWLPATFSLGMGLMHPVNLTLGTCIFADTSYQDMQSRMPMDQGCRKQSVRIWRKHPCLVIL
jgi:hypothetical protein